MVYDSIFTRSGFHPRIRSSQSESMRKATHSGFFGYLVEPAWSIAGVTVHGPVVRFQAACPPQVTGRSDGCTVLPLKLAPIAASNWLKPLRFCSRHVYEAVSRRSRYNYGWALCPKSQFSANHCRRQRPLGRVVGRLHPLNR